MRIGLITDIHGNLEALEAVLSVLDRQRLDYLACLGDVVGYGAQPDECCDRVRTLADVCVLGNHDAAVSGRMDYSYYRLPARDALDLHRSMLSETNAAWLAALPYAHALEGVTFCHGSPAALEDFEYIFVLDQMRELVARHADQADVTFIGHSHLCKAFAFDHERSDEILRTRFELEPDRKHLITVGSVGQPRDYDPRACCAVYDTERRAFEFIRVPYDIEAAARKIVDAGLSVTFGKRLFLGVPVQHEVFHKPGQREQRNIGQHPQFQEQPLTLAVFGQIRNSGIAGFRDRPIPHGRTLIADFTTFERLQTADRLKNIRPARANKPGKPKNLALAKVESHVPHP